MLNPHLNTCVVLCVCVCVCVCAPAGNTVCACAVVCWSGHSSSSSSFFFPKLPHSTSVCGGPCPWGLLFWFNSAPHGWTQSDTSNPVKGDVQWSWSYTTAAPRRKDGLVLRWCLHVKTLFFFYYLVQTREPEFEACKQRGFDSLTWSYVAKLLNCHQHRNVLHISTACCLSVRVEENPVYT